MIEFEKTAISVKKTLMHGMCYSFYEGANRLYGVLAEGEYATFIVIDIDKEKIIFEEDIPGASGSWAVAESSDHRVYFATYVNGGLYRFDPLTKSIETIFENIDNLKFIFTLDTDSNNNIYGGTWPGCAVFKYNGNTEKLEYYNEKIVKTEDYVKVVLYNKKRDTVFTSVSAHAHLIEYDFKKGPIRSILPEKYKKVTSVKLMGIREDKLVAFIPKANRILVIDIESGDVTSDIEAPDMTKETLPYEGPIANLVTGIHNDGLMFDIETYKTYVMKTEEGKPIAGIWNFFDGHSLIMSSGEGEIYIYDTISGIKKKINVRIPRKNIEIRQLHTAKDGAMYSTGFLRGGNNIYDSKTNTGIQYDGIGQCEGITSYNGKVYMGKYPGANIYEFDTKKPWCMPQNPRKLFELGTTANQDRPFAMKVFDGKLYIGTIPDYGDTQGSLTVYDIEKGTYESRKSFSDSRSIVSFAYSDGIIYGGTTVCGGLGSRIRHEDGTIFAMNAATGEYMYEIVPVKGCRNVGGLCITDDNKVIGCADSTFFILNPKTSKIEYKKKLAKFDRVKDYKWEVSFIKKGPGRLYYIVTANTLFSYDHSTRNFEQLVEEKVNLLEFDKQGRLYCQYEENVRQIIRSVNPVK